MPHAMWLRRMISICTQRCYIVMVLKVTYAVSNKILNELRDLKYDKRHGTQSFKEVAVTFSDLYTRMAGQDPGQL
jgi:hypothetical protein